MANIVLIGMPGCGKSTVGVLLAKALGLDFLDTDVFLQAREGRLLQRMIDEDGVDAFLLREEDAVLAVECDQTVIATGGSVVYSSQAMKHLKQNGIVVYLDLPYEDLLQRLSNLATRGVTLRKGQTLKDLYDERTPLYAHAASITVRTAGMDIDRTVSELKRCLEGMAAHGE